MTLVNSTHLTCKFGSMVGQSVQYVSPTKVLCTSPHFPLGYGRAVVPVRVAVNGVDFSAVSDAVHFEFHEPLVIKQATPLVGLPRGGTIVNITLDDTTLRLRAVLNENNQVTISHIDPPYGPETGGNLVALYGSDFTPNQFTACRFGDIVMQAYFVSEESKFECSAPKSDTINK